MECLNNKQNPKFVTVHFKENCSSERIALMPNYDLSNILCCCLIKSYLNLYIIIIYLIIYIIIVYIIIIYIIIIYFIIIYFIIINIIIVYIIII